MDGTYGASPSGAMKSRPVTPRLALLPLASALLTQLTACGCSKPRPSPDSGEASPPATGKNIGSAGGARLDHNARGEIVVLGSSTSAGTGPSKPENAWVERYRAYLKAEFPKFQLTNLAVGGYTTYHVQPSDYAPGGNLPRPDKSRNITMALALKPNAIIINLPSNDANADYSAEAQMANFERITALARQSGVPCWVTTTQPRNFEHDSAAVRLSKRSLLLTVRDAIKQKYGEHTLDFWTQFAEADGSIKAMYGNPDGVHLNDAAHALLVQAAIKAKIPEAVIGSPR